MILNDLLTRQNVFTKLILKDGDKELPKELKVKIMRIRMAYAKVKKAFDSDMQTFMEELISPEFKELSGKSERTAEEESRFEELSKTINSEYQIFLTQKGKEEVDMVDDSFTEEEYAELVEVNSGNDIEINGVKIPAIEFLEVVYELFVKEN